MTMSYIAARVPLKLGTRRQRRAVWELASQQRQAFNHGVALCLEAISGGEQVPSKYDLHKVLTQHRRADEAYRTDETGKLVRPGKNRRMPFDVPVALQRPGLEAGREAVLRWSESRRKMEGDVVYWSVRLAAAELLRDGHAKWAAAVLADLNSSARIKPDRDAEVAYCARRHDKARQKLQRHVDQGTARLFHTRKEFEAEPRNCAAITYNERAILDEGIVRLSGGLKLRLADSGWFVPEGHEWTGAVQLVDATRKATARTRPEHRRWVLHAILKRANPDPIAAVPVTSDEVLGVDAGCVVHAAVSDGRMLNMDPEEDLNERIEAAQRQRSRCTYGSRKWNRLTRELQKLYTRRTNRRDNGSRQLASAIVKTPGIAVVGIEKTKAMMASAAGTAARPGRNVAAKRALNRKLSDARFGGVRKDIQRSAVRHGTRVVEVPAAYTSKLCDTCGNPVIRESQSTYWCLACQIIGHADRLAACNVRELTVCHANGATDTALRDSASLGARVGGIPALSSLLSQRQRQRQPCASQTSMATVPPSGAETAV